MTALALVALIAADPTGDPHDLVIYGGTSAAVIAAVQATDDGLDVVVVSPDEHLGGLTSGGLGWTDSGRKEVIGGLSRQFYRDLMAHYSSGDAWREQTKAEYFAHPRFERKTPVTDDAWWVFEPSVAEAVFERYVAENDLDVRRGRDQRLDRAAGVVMDGARLVSIRTLGGDTYAGRMFMDCTYEGDLMAAAGVSYAVGREPNSQYGETINGVQLGRKKHQFPPGISPYVVAGDPASGLLPHVHGGDPGEQGQGDDRVQAYCFRMCLTDAPENRIPFPKPDGYDPREYELLGRVLDTGWGSNVFNKFDPAPNRKTDTNNHGPFSTDKIGGNYDYPEASYERREQIVAEHERYQKGLMWFLANDPRVPEGVRAEMSRWGLAADEFADNGHWPHQIYVREARRMVGPVVMSEPLVRGFEPVPQSVGMGSYNMDSHNVQRYVRRGGEDGQSADDVQNEGDVQITPGGSYPISYLSIVPRQAEATNLTVPVAVSASHIAYGSIRMEPVFMILGQSAAVAVQLALEADIPLQEVPYDRLRQRLESLGQILDHPTSTQNTKTLRVADLAGIVADDAAAATTGQWVHSSATKPHVGTGYLATKAPGATATWTLTPPPGRYEVRLAGPVNPNRSERVAVAVGDRSATLSQRTLSQRTGDLLKAAGTVTVGEGDEVTVQITAADDGYTIADAVQLVPVDE